MKKCILFFAFIFIVSYSHAQTGEQFAGGTTTSGVILQDEGTNIKQARFLNFTGAGVSAATTSGKYVITISGSGGDGDFSTITVTADSITTDALVYTDKIDGYSAMRITELVVSGKMMLKSDAPICIDYTESETIIIRYSASAGTKTTLKIEAKPNEITVNGIIQNNWKFDEKGLTLTLSEGTGTVEIK